jgi:hypothetical protein
VIISRVSSWRLLVGDSIIALGKIRGAPLLLLIGQQIVCAGLQGCAIVSPKWAMGGREFARGVAARHARR